MSKFKNFTLSKDTIKEVKRQPTEWKKMFTYISDKGLKSRVNKEFLKFSSKKTGQLKMDKGFE